MIAGIVLAAGRSRRMGTPKLALPWKNGRTVVESVVAALRDGGVGRIVVVVGGDRQAVERALASSQVEFTENPHFADDEMLGSIQHGLRAIGDGPQAVLLAPGDLPAFQPETVRALIKAWTEAAGAVCAPVHGGRRGHPVLLPRSVWPDVLSLGAGESLRSYLRLHQAEIVRVEVADAGIRADIDTPQDYRGTRREGDV